MGEAKRHLPVVHFTHCWRRVSEGGAGGSWPLGFCNLPVNFVVDNFCLLVSGWQNEISLLFPPWKKSFWQTPGKFHYCPPSWKILPTLMLLKYQVDWSHGQTWTSCWRVLRTFSDVLSIIVVINKEALTRFRPGGGGTVVHVPWGKAGILPDANCSQQNNSQLQTKRET